MFATINKVRVHDTDMAGLLYFPRQFRFTHEALEDFMESEKIPFARLFHDENFIFPVVHCEADYRESLQVGDELEIHVGVEKIGTTSFAIFYNIYRNRTEVGSAKTIHVTLNRTTREKIPVPDKLKNALKKHMQLPPAVR